ncbi:unnamed protein product, partial [Brenthis ino]
MSLQPKDIVIDLTSSFTLAVHNFSNTIIELDSDESFNLSPDENLPKSKKPSKRKADEEIMKMSQGSSKRLCKDRTSSKFGNCAICWDELGTNPLASTKCGHVYCLKCLEQSLQIEKRCPTCRSKLTGKLAYHPLYLNK